MSIVSFVNKIGDVLGPVIFAYIYINRGLDGVFLGAAILCVAALCFSLIFVKNSASAER